MSHNLNQYTRFICLYFPEKIRATIAKHRGCTGKKLTNGLCHYIAFRVRKLCQSPSHGTFLLLHFSKIHDGEIEDGCRMKIDLIWFLFSFFHFIFSVYLSALNLFHASAETCTP